MTTTSAKTGSKASSSPRTSLSPLAPTTPTSRLKPNASPTASAAARAPAGLCAASSTTVGAAAHDLQPARRGDRRRRPCGRCRRRAGRACWAPTPKNASTAASATAALCAWWAPCSGRKTSVVLAAEAAQRQQLAADGDLAGDDAELQALAGHRGVHLDGLLQQHLRRVHRLLGQDRRWRPA